MPGARRRSAGHCVTSYAAAEIARALGQPPPTDEQAAVIESPSSSCLVVAGAGSGKTETMAGRVVWLVANGLVRPDQVLGLTFTRKAAAELAARVRRDRKSTRLNSSHTVIYTLSLHDALPIWARRVVGCQWSRTTRPGAWVDLHPQGSRRTRGSRSARSEEHTSELQSHRDLHSFPTRRSSDLGASCGWLPMVSYDQTRCLG